MEVRAGQPAFFIWKISGIFLNIFFCVPQKNVNAVWNDHAFYIGWPYMPFFPARVLARISILPKISRFWLCLRVQTDRSSKYHTDSSLCFQNTLEVLWCQTLIGLSHAALSRTHLICMCICIALTVDPTFSHTMIGPLCTMPACYWSNYFSIITFSKYKNRKTKPKQILARTCPGKMARMVTLFYMQLVIFKNCSLFIWSVEKKKVTWIRKTIL